MARKSKATAALLIFAIAIVAWIFAGRIPTAQPDWDPIVESGSIKTNFFRDARLSPSELELVVSLAKQSGLVDVSEVSTFPRWPGADIGICARSIGHVDGRNYTYESVEIQKLGWVRRKPDNEGVKREGDFWLDPATKRKTLVRRYEFSGQTIGVEIGEGVDVAVADKAIPLIGAKKVRLKDNAASRQSLEFLVKEMPRGIGRGRSGGYELWFGDRFLQFDLEWGRVVITGEGSVVF